MAITVVILAKTHRRGVPHRIIQAIHHDRSVEPIQDLSRPQADVNHGCELEQTSSSVADERDPDHFLIELISLSVLPKLAASIVVIGRCLDPIQATHLTGDSGHHLLHRRLWPPCHLLECQQQRRLPAPPTQVAPSHWQQC
ncbi:hypothetical protein ACLOJK_022593 [Asimina triloba]